MAVRRPVLRLGRASWTTGEIIAATVLAVAGLPLLLTALISIVGVIFQSSAWLWSAGGGLDTEGTQQSMARAAWAGVVVGIITIIMLGFTLAYTHMSVRLYLIGLQQTRHLGERQVRAYVAAHDLKVSFPGKRNFAVPPQFIISVTNSGQTPARRVRMVWGWQNHLPTDLLRVDQGEVFSVLEIGAGQSITQDVPCQDFVNNVFMLHLVADGESWIQGVIEYVDVFDQEHFSWFRARVTGAYPNAEPMLFTEATQDGNLST